MAYFENIIGQQHLIDDNGPLNRMLKNENLHSFILYGKSGIGKTTLANTFGEESNHTVITLNGAKTTKTEFVEVLKTYNNSDVIILIDEIHRLDKAKQNLLLPYLEKENIVIIGTTTEDVHFSLIPPMLSRMLIFEMKDLNAEELEEYLKVRNKEDFSDNILDDEILKKIIQNADGDIRKGIKYFEFLAKNYTNEEISNVEAILDNIIVPNRYYNSEGKEHYDYVSAFQKSIRASDVNASVYYLMKLLNMGDYAGLLRRLIVIANEDIGLANPELVYAANDVVEAFNKIGMPEGGMLLTNYVIELALSPKSRLGYESSGKALKAVKERPNEEIPGHIKIDQVPELKYDKRKAFFTNNLPRRIKDREFVEISENTTYEKKLKKRKEYLDTLKSGEKGYYE